MNTRSNHPILATVAVASLAGLAMAGSTTTVTEFAPSDNTTPGVWYESFITGAGAAMIADLTGTPDFVNHPLPVGAACLTTTADNNDRANVGVLDDYGAPADVFDTLQLVYWSYKASNGSQNLAAAPALKLSFFNATCDDPASADDCFGILVFEPTWNQPGFEGSSTNPPLDTWQSWTIDKDNGLFWWTGGFGEPNTAGGPPLRTLGEWLALFSSDFDDAAFYLVEIGVGSFNQNQLGYFDNVQISHTFGGGYNALYDFEPPPCPGDGDCYTANGTPGCDDEACCNAVCDAEPFCCDVGWDQTCKDMANELCGDCGAPGAGSCYEANGTPGCDDLDCCRTVCEFQPFCCADAWDEVCKALANELCGNCGDPGAGDCCVENGTPGCDDTECCRTICELDPNCCADAWDGLCVSVARKICDETPPVLECPGDVTVECDESTDPADTGMATATDDCDPAPSVTFTDLVELDGCNGTGTITRTWIAENEAELTSTCEQTITVEDSTPPEIHDCPDDITVNSDAPGCGANVFWAPPTASDNCGLMSLTSSHAPGAFFGTGDTLVTYTAVDNCGLETDCTFTVTVEPVNEVEVTVQIEGSGAATRCIHFIALNCGAPGVGDPPSEPVDVLIDFDEAGIGSATIEIPCGVWTHLCAKDEKHTQWGISALDIVADGVPSAVPYITLDTLFLTSGDNDNDGDVDINDVTLFLIQFGADEPGDDEVCPWDGIRGADFSNNDDVGAEDFSLLSANWLTTSACACEDAKEAQAPKTSMPATSIDSRVVDRVDLDRNGVIDWRDVAIFERENGLPPVLSTRIRLSAEASGP